jgi:hypothetical protein
LFFCHITQNKRIYLDNLLKEISDISVVVEMRNVNWQNEQIYNALKSKE